MTSQVTGIENLSKTRTFYPNELSFADRALKLNTKKDVLELVDAISRAENLQVIRLEGNTVSPEAAEELSKALEKHPELERFIGNDLFTGRLKDEIPLALKSMFGAIDKSGAHLVELNLSDNAFGPIGLEGLVAFLSSASCYSLKEIRMHNNGLGPQGGQKFAHALEQCYEKSGQKLALKTFICGRNRLELEGSRALSAILGKIGTLEEIQMPQNGIRPFAIDNIAQCFASNKQLRVVSLNDNTLGKQGGELMAKALTELNNLEYVNFGDCLLKSKGALQIARGLVNSQKLIEVILSFNEINLNAGIDLAKILVTKRETLKLLDLNGNKFGEDGKLEIQSVLAPIGSSLGTLSEDEGSDDEDEEDGEDADEEDEEEEEEEEGEYDEEDYENYDDEEDDGSYDEEDEEDYDDLAENVENTVQINEDNQPAIQASSLFSQLKPSSVFNGGSGGGVFGQGTKVNPFETMTKNKHLFTQIKSFDAFIVTPTEQNLLQVDDQALDSICQLEKFNGTYLVNILDTISKAYDDNSKLSEAVVTIASTLVKNYLSKAENLELFSEALLTYFGFLKSEDKAFKPVVLSDNMMKLLKRIFSQTFVPKTLKDKLLEFLNIRSAFDKSALYVANSEKLAKCF